MPHEPKRRHSKQRKGKRRASINLEMPALSSCANCGHIIKPHIVCKTCGFYKGKMVLGKTAK